MFCRAMRLLTEHRNQLEALVQALLKEDSLGEEQILAVTGLKAAASDKNPLRLTPPASTQPLTSRASSRMLACAPCPPWTT